MKNNNKKPAAKAAIPVRKTVAAGKLQKESATVSLSDSFERHFAGNQRFYFYLITAVAALFSFLCFDNKISLANDDALYIESGASYAKDFFGYFYIANAPLYPMLLGILIKLFGVKLFLLKLFSLLFFVSGIAVFFQSFKNRIPAIVLVPALFLTAINFPYLMYASLTYAETFFLMVMGICFLVYFNILDSIEKDNDSLKTKILYPVIIGLLCFWLMLTRNVALIAILIFAGFLVYKKKYIAAAVSTASFAGFYFLYKLLLKFVWHIDGSQFANQSNLMFKKDVYNPQLGDENLMGFVDRFWGNCQIYISSRLYYVLGFREELSLNHLGLTLISIAVVLYGLYLTWKNKSDILLFTTVFYLVLLGVTFISLHTTWGQSRLIMSYLPLILFTFFYILYDLGKKFPFTQFVLPFFVFVLMMSSLKLTFSQIKTRFPIFLENMQGDPTYGYTPDWQNYIKMSKWCAQNLPKENIAVRKAPMSFIFSEGKEFYPIYSTPTQNPDSLLMPLEQNKVNYIMPAELRANPDMYIQDQIIGTVHRYMYYIQLKYPNAFEFVHQEGDIEKSQLYKIRWDYIDSMKNTSVSTP